MSLKFNNELINHVQQNAEVLPGNIYPAHGGRRKPGTEYWLVVAVSETGAHCLGYDADGNPVSTASYLKSAMRQRPVVGQAKLGSLVLKRRGEVIDVTDNESFSNDLWPGCKP